MGGNWLLITEKEQINFEYLQTLNPKYIFFPHWSYLVDEAIVNQFNCVCFHMTDLPFGRGGSPLQNCIVYGLKETKLTALKMTTDLDAGPIYAKLPLSLAGRAQDIYNKASDMCYQLMEQIINNNLIPEPQKGEGKYFKRRKPEQSYLNTTLTLDALYDHIRMLDADGYPKAFIIDKNTRIEFSHAKFEDGKLTAEVNIMKV